MFQSVSWVDGRAVSLLLSTPFPTLGRGLRLLGMFPHKYLSFFPKFVSPRFTPSIWADHTRTQGRDMVLMSRFRATEDFGDHHRQRQEVNNQTKKLTAWALDPDTEHSHSSWSTALATLGKEFGTIWCVTDSIWINRYSVNTVPPQEMHWGKANRLLRGELHGIYNLIDIVVTAS